MLFINLTISWTDWISRPRMLVYGEITNDALYIKSDYLEGR